MATRRTHAPALLCALVLVLAACSSGEGGESTTTTSTTVAAPETTTTTTVPVETTTTLPPDVDAGLDLPVEASYAHVVFTLTDAEYSNAEPGRYLEDEPTMGTERYLYVGFSADFEPTYPGRTEQFDTADFSLLLADGTSIGNEMVDFRSSLLVSDDGLTLAFAFPGDDLDLAGASVVYDNAIDEPLVLPLDGSWVDPYPITEAVDATAEVAYEGGCSPALGTATVVAARWDVDGGVDQDGKTIITAGTARSKAGERFVRIAVEAIAQSGNCGGTIVNDDAYRLFVDGLPIGPENRFVTGLDDGEGAEIIWAFRVPVDTEELILEVGLAGEQTASFPIPIPASLP